MLQTICYNKLMFEMEANPRLANGFNFPIPKISLLFTTENLKLLAFLNQAAATIVALKLGDLLTNRLILIAKFFKNFWLTNFSSISLTKNSKLKTFYHKLLTQQNSNILLPKFHIQSLDSKLHPTTSKQLQTEFGYLGFSNWESQEPVQVSQESWRLRFLINSIVRSQRSGQERTRKADHKRFHHTNGSLTIWTTI